jgi:hypothetical protein
MEDQRWIARLVEYQGAEGSLTGRDPFILRVAHDGGMELKLPASFADADVRGVSADISEDLLTFVYDLVAVGVTELFPMPVLAVSEIPVKERDPLLPTQFRIGLATGDTRRCIVSHS